MRMLSALLILTVCAAAARAEGLLVPTDTSVPPLAIRSHRVNTEINNQGAVTNIEQVFENNTDRQLEASYIFPIPRDASVSKFTMLVNGVDKKGEMVEKNHARQIYNSIVSRAQDPGLLEYIGQDLFRANVFPILPRSTQKITISYVQIVKKEGEFVSYTYPLRRGDKQGPVVRNDFTLLVAIKSAVPIKSVYSPSHAIAVSRPADTEAKVSFELNQASLDKDFQLFYSVSEKNVGLNMIAHRPDKAKPGHFMMLISPRSKAQEENLVKRDLVFVFDNSASMAGEKIVQARAALKLCVQSLNAGDRFNIVKFSTDVEPWKGELVDAASSRDAALAYIDTIEPEGGTNIDGALRAAISYQKDPARPYIVVFMTDGKPTLGETTDPKQILKNLITAQSEAAKMVRIFTWGVGYDVDTHLLDQIAEQSSGISEYVKPKEHIAEKVGAFFNKASRPVLTDLRLEVVGSKVQLVNVYPKKISDLYAGSQIVVTGQYVGEGAVALRLTGQINDKSETFTYETDFPAQAPQNGFIEVLWARRRIGHLLDSIRLHGESEELVTEVIRLSKEHGIQTPYTSYLVLEDGMTVPTDPGQPRPRPVPQTAGRWQREGERDRRVLKSEDASRLNELSERMGGMSNAAAAKAAPAADEEKRKEALELADDLAQNFDKADGKSGVAVSRYLQDLKRSDSAGEQAQAAAFKKAAGTKFFAFRGMLVDERFEAANKITQIKFGSEAYFLILEKRPELKEVFKLGTALIYITSPGKALVIGSTGNEKISEDEIAKLF